jgi:hypothetical protein
MKSLKKTKKQYRSIRKKKSLVRIPLTTQGGLFGYHVDMPLDARRSLLKNILRKNLATYSEVVKRLNVLSIYNKNRHPEISKRVIRDMRYIQKSTKRKSTKRKSSKRKSTKRRSTRGGAISKSTKRKSSKRRSSSGCSGL